jgi:formate dehydrogenase iron-sulfur subunit
VTCKQWNDLPGEQTELNDSLGLQNPKTVSARTFTLITYHEVPDSGAPGGLKYIFTKRQCMHCEDPACASACPVTALHKTAEGPVVYDSNKCIGCRYCVLACPFGAPTAEWNSLTPRIRKCNLCYDRLSEPVADVVNGTRLSVSDQASHVAAQAVPACVKQCPSGALEYGDRATLLAEARKRIETNPAHYVNHIYGEKEAGGTDVLYLASVPFDQLGFPPVQNHSYTTPSVTALRVVSPAVVGVGAMLGATYALRKRKEEVALKESSHETPRVSQPSPHATFAAAAMPLSKTTKWSMAAIMGLGAISFAARFLLGLGATTNLSDTYPWGLWIVFDLIWIALAAGAFATAGLIYVWKREDLYPIGRSAVLIGFLSYLFVAVILVADLGLPWHAWQFALQSPKHSAMFEVAWCVGLYLSILAFEFLPVPLERWSIRHGLELWRKYNAVYVVAAVSFFVYLMSRNVAWVAATAALFSLLAYAFRPREGEKPTPIMLAIAAVTLSTMHQSSLGSLFLLMRDKLSPAWWSPIMPVEFLLSAVAGGIAFVILLQIWITKTYRMKFPIVQLTALARVSFYMWLVYAVVRFADIAIRGQIAEAILGPKRGWFIAEAVLMIAPLIFFGFTRLRNRPALLQVGATLAASEVVLNRSNAVLLAMTLRGPIPQIAPAPYFPSMGEWGIALAPVAATVILFMLAAGMMPVLPKDEVGAS